MWIEIDGQLINTDNITRIYSDYGWKKQEVCIEFIGGEIAQGYNITYEAFKKKLISSKSKVMNK